MQINAGELGTFEIDEKDIIVFEKGLIGMGGLKRFVMLPGDDQGVFTWLISVDDETKCYILTDTQKFISDYKPLPSGAKIAELGEYGDVSELTVLNVTVVPDDFMDMTVNLKAPVVINTAEKKGFQFVSDNEKFPVKYYIQRELQKLRAGE